MFLWINDTLLNRDEIATMNFYDVTASSSVYLRIFFQNAPFLSKDFEVCCLRGETNSETIYNKKNEIFNKLMVHLGMDNIRVDLSQALDVSIFNY